MFTRLEGNRCAASGEWFQCHWLRWDRWCNDCNREFGLAIICCRQQIPLNNQIQWATVDNNLRNYRKLFLFWSQLLNCNQRDSLAFILFYLITIFSRKMLSAVSTFFFHILKQRLRWWAGQWPCVDRKAHWYLNHERDQHNGGRCQGGVHTEGRLMRWGVGGGRAEDCLPLGCSQLGGRGPLIYEWMALITSPNTLKGMRLLQMGLWGIGGWIHLLVQTEWWDWSV